jgi:hypothetical protein
MRTPEHALSAQATGLLLSSIGVIVLSLEGPLIRLVDVDAGTILAVRGIFSAIGLFVFFLSSRERHSELNSAR